MEMEVKETTNEMDGEVIFDSNQNENESIDSEICDENEGIQMKMN